MSEAFAPTVPHPNVGGAPWLQAEQSTARVPITDVDAALRKMDPVPAKKTLASNVHFNEELDDQASLRKTARSSKPVAVSNERATDPGVGPALEQAQPKAKRRATQSGRKSTAKLQIEPSDVAATRVVAPFQPIPGIPAGNVAIVELDSRGAEPPGGHRFEDEGTLEQHATLVGISYDLDEQTNVLSGLESNIVLQANAAEKTEAEHALAPSDANERKDELAALETTPTSELVRDRPATERPPSEALRSLAAYRIALGRTSNGGLEVKLLAPGEPTPAGRVGAILVPTDAISSSSLFDLLTAKPR